jgi:hypothetical protein
MEIIKSYVNGTSVFKFVFLGIQKLERDISEGKVQPLEEVVRGDGQEQGRTSKDFDDRFVH